VEATSKTNKPEIEPLVTLKDACRILSVSERTARAWVAMGSFPVVRLSRRAIRLRLSDLKKFIDDRITGRRGGA
jgi:excisionase family DNA binding protein